MNNHNTYKILFLVNADNGVGTSSFEMLASRKPDEALVKDIAKTIANSLRAPITVSGDISYTVRADKL